MKCYYHHDRDAFGICQACGKALCLECMDTTNNVTKCKNSNFCKEIVRLQNITYGNIRATFTKSQKMVSTILGLLFLLSGIAGIGITFIIEDSFMLVPSLIFIVVGSAIFYSACRMRVS